MITWGTLQRMHENVRKRSAHDETHLQGYKSCSKDSNISPENGVCFLVFLEKPAYCVAAQLAPLQPEMHLMAISSCKLDGTCLWLASIRNQLCPRFNER